MFNFFRQAFSPFSSRPLGKRPLFKIKLLIQTFIYFSVLPSCINSQEYTIVDEAPSASKQKTLHVRVAQEFYVGYIRNNIQNIQVLFKEYLTITLRDFKCRIINQFRGTQSGQNQFDVSGTAGGKYHLNLQTVNRMFKRSVALY